MTEPTPRQCQFPINALFHQRWSPRAMSGQSVSKAELFSLFEAARWAPSCFNEQPWRIAYSLTGDEHWQRFFGLLVEGNQRWAHKAGALLVVAAQTTFSRNDKPSRTHAFDTGAAWQNIALQGTCMGLVVHAMAGFDYDAAASVLNVPANCSVQAMIAVGKPGKIADLDESFRDKEFPSDRMKTEAFVVEGSF